MFLSNNPDPSPIFQAYHSNAPDLWSIWGVRSLLGNTCARKIACWFHDMQYAIDHEDFENAQLFLTCLSRHIYQMEIKPDSRNDLLEKMEMEIEWERREFETAFYAIPRHKPLTGEERDEYDKGIAAIKAEARKNVNQRDIGEAENIYRSILNNLEHIAYKCDTLSMAKEQMGAFERQQQKNASPVPLDYEIPDIPEATLNALCNLQLEYLNFFTKQAQNKGTFIEAYKKLWESCKKQPISLVLLPTLLTSLMIEEIEHKSVYARLKQTKRYVSADNLKKIAQLYKDICEVLQLGYNNCTSWWTPIFNWKEIENRFYEYNRLSKEEQKIAHNYLSKLRYKNGLSKSEERELAQVPYGSKLQALAKICNLNCFMMLALQTPGKMEPPDLRSKEIVVPAKAKSAYKLLLSNQILPCAEGAPKTFDNYFEGLYTRSYGISDFSYIALLRYYRLSIDQVHEYIPLGLKKLAGLFSSRTSEYVRRITAAFKHHQNSSPMYDNLESKGANKSSGVVIDLGPLGNSEFRAGYIRNSYRLSSQIADKFSEEDYREFISNIDHFENPCFGRYLDRFCKKRGINLYPVELGYENVFLENAAFATIMELVQCYLEKNFYSYWKNHISSEFGLYDDNAPKA